MRYGWLSGLVAAGVLVCLASQAGATGYATLTATFVDDSPWQAGYTSMNSGDSLQGAWEVGRSVFTVNSLTVNTTGVPADLSAFLATLAPTKQFTGWCVDINREIWQNTQHTWVISNLADVPAEYTMGGVKAQDLQTLFTSMPQGATVTADQAAAFQAAVWEVVNETTLPYNVTTGNFRVSGNSTWINGANSLLTNLASDTISPVYAMYSTDTQNFAFFVPATGNRQVVPEPITFVTGLMVVSGLGAYIRRRTRIANA